MDLYYSMLKVLGIVLLALFIAYILGLTIVNVVDKRLSNIKINVPKQNVIVEGFDDWLTLKTDKVPVPVPDELKGYQQGEKYAPLERQLYAKDLWNAGRPVVCFKNHNHTERVSQGCMYGPCNFVNPRKMAEIDKNFFMQNYRPINMTLQDYVNWLWLYAGGDVDRLPYEHVKNLIKMQKGEKLIYEVGVLPPPIECMPAMNAEDQFNCTYGNLETQGPLADCSKFIKGYNADEYS